MKIAILTTGRFHVLDLARELDNLGYDIKFFSYITLNRAKKFGLPIHCHQSLLPYVFFLLLIQKLLPNKCNLYINILVSFILDNILKYKIKDVDCIIAMSGIFTKTLSKLKANNKKVKIFVERGSSHILTQDLIVNHMKNKGAKIEKIPNYFIKRELIDYDNSDFIVIPSIHVYESFLENGVSKDKLFLNNYGVDINMFKPTEIDTTQQPTVLYVGNWSYRKGSDILIKIIEELPEFKFIHVGTVGDVRLPNLKNFIHYEKVNQWNLPDYYKQSHVFIMPSREEGQALVQLQALLSGLPLVCTDKTGGMDFKTFLKDPKFISCVESENIIRLKDELKKMMKISLDLKGKRSLFLDPKQLTWESYAKKYSSKINSAY